MTSFAEWLQGGDLSPHTIRAHLSRVAVYARWHEAHTGHPPTPADITAADWRQYRAHLAAGRASANTINAHYDTLRAYMRWGLASGLIEHSPLARIRRARRQPLAPRWLERREVYRLERALELAINGASTPAARWAAARNRAAVVLMLRAGLRAAEVAGLDRGDISILPRSGWARVARGKGDKARAVPLGRDTREALAAWLAAAGSADPAAPLLVSERGGRLTPDGLHHIVTTLARRAGVDNCTPHTLRHTCARALSEAGIPEAQISAILGHDSATVTRRYTLPSAADLARAVSVLDP